jgi:hypothetical protein
VQSSSVQQIVAHFFSSGSQNPEVHAVSSVHAVPFAEPPVIGFAITNAVGNRLFGGNSRVHPPQTNDFDARVSSKGPHRVVFEFADLPLATGEYFVVAAIHDHKLERTVAIWQHACRFKVKDEQDPTNFDGDLIRPRLRPATVHLQR